MTSDSGKLIAAVLAELVRIHQSRPQVDRVTATENRVFVETVDPLHRRVICIGTGEWLDEWFPGNFGQIGEFGPRYIDILNLGETRLEGDERERIVQEWINRQTGEVRIHLPDRMDHVRMRLEDAWWGQIELIRSPTVVGEFYRRSAAAYLSRWLDEPVEDHDKYVDKVRACLRYCFPNTLIRGTTATPLLDEKPCKTIVYTVHPRSAVLSALRDVGYPGQTLRFEPLPHEEPSEDDVKNFAKSLRRASFSKIGFLTSRGTPSWDFRALAADLRSSANYIPLILSLTHGELLALIANVERNQFRDNESWLSDRLKAAYHDANRTYTYQITCMDGSDRDCHGSVENYLDIGGLKRGQLRDLANGHSIELDGEQVRRNRHVLSLEQQAAAHRGEPVYLELELDTVCSACGSDSNPPD
ncbi:hypothetical protein [Lysobacter arvi]|uniref:TIR domain-containing protein n=1 Tax=Lysobacter arvi TaxID=3038776 RepID=A0ABU1CH26_9GAMM|nr:hypothetical protein [Lysobacter arvi]MDR0184256.1 hypothetical protein [Lysobacter arvi]